MLFSGTKSVDEVPLYKKMKKFFLSGIFLILFAAVIATQLFFDKEKAKAVYSEPIVPKANIVRIADLGLHNAAADLEWLSMIQYFGGGESRTYEKLDGYLFLTTDLDPKFPYPYAFGALILPGFGQVDRGIEIGQKGIDAGIVDYRLPYYMATTYHIEKDDPVNAAKYFDLAARTPGVLDGIKRVAANYGTRGDKREKTKQIWIGIFESTKDEMVKERAKDYIVHYEIMDLLEAAAKEYNKRNGKFPTDINDLVTAKILTAIPPDPFGYSFVFDEAGNVRAN